jgi:primase-polymerase (primpol)-like protein
LLDRPKQAGFQRLVDKSEGFVFIDIDNCENPETKELTPLAKEVVAALNTYCEISASGKGRHLVCRGTLTDDFHVEGSPIEISAHWPPFRPRTTRITSYPDVIEQTAV